MRYALVHVAPPSCWRYTGIFRVREYHANGFITAERDEMLTAWGATEAEARCRLLSQAEWVFQGCGFILAEVVP
jgi:hypothetical protein